MKTEKITIPGGYDELPLGTYLRVLDAAAEEGLDDIERNTAILAALAGVDGDTLLDLPLEEYAALSARARFLEWEPERRKPSGVCVAGEFRLVPVDDMRRVTAAQYIDFQTFARGGARKMPELLSCMLVPEGRRYGEGYDVLLVQQALRDHLPVTDALGACDFFLRSFQKSMRRILISSAAEAMAAAPTGRARRSLAKETARLLAALRRAGAGSPASTPSPRPAAAPGRRSGK